MNHHSIDSRHRARDYVNNPLRYPDRGLNVAIGSETGMQTLAECALVIAPYTVDGERVGSSL